MTRAHDRGRRRRTRRGRLLVLAGVPFGLLGSGLLVWQASYAAFTGTTTTTGSTLTTGTVVLQNNVGTGLISVNPIKPGQAGSACINVAYNGTLNPSGPVKIYSGSTVTDGKGIATKLFFSVEAIAGGAATTSTVPAAPSGNTCDTATANATTSFGSVTSTTSGPPTTTYLSTFLGQTTYGTGSATTWTPAAQTGTNVVYVTFRVRWQLDSSTADSFQGGTLSNLSITWEAQS